MEYKYQLTTKGDTECKSL